MAGKLLKTLDLRNMFIDTNECEEMENMISLTLRCVKVVGEALKHINDTMPKLQTLALLGVFGAEGGVLTFEDMRVLCLGLSTPATAVIMNLPKLEKLQLKMQCPQKLIIEARILKYVAFNLEVLEPSKVDLKKSMVGLEELLYGATSFLTLSDLLMKNIHHLQKLFLDIPCMALGEDGRFLGVLKDIVLNLPSFSRLHQCEKLKVLNIGPGLWHSMETQVETIVAEERWPSIQDLILHMIPHSMEAAMTVLRMLLRPSVTSLTIFIHTSSPVTRELMIPRIEEVVSRQNIIPHILPWTKSLDFSCFSF